MTLFQRLTCSAAFGLALLPALASQSFAAPKVVASIKPINSLVAAVMEGVGVPDLIVTGANSPHSYALKPSQAQALEQADLIFWMGHELEAFLEKPIETIGTKAKAIELIDVEGLTKLKFREGGTFEAHEHDHADHDKDHDHDAEKAHDDHEHTTEEAHEDHAHHHGEFDPHMWLDPENAKVFVGVIANALSKSDPDNATTYAKNAAAEITKLDALEAEIKAELAPVKDKHFIVFHDAYHYFENRFGLAAVGSITLNPETKPSAARLAAIKDKVTELHAVCAFSEPQFNAKLVSVAIEGSNARTSKLDPLGANLDDGPDLYFDLIKNLSTSMKTCLSGK